MHVKNETRGTSLNVQWLRCYAANAGSPKNENKERMETGPVPLLIQMNSKQVNDVNVSPEIKETEENYR